jgi:hypothetical protein
LAAQQTADARFWTIWVTRPDDLVVLTFEFENYELVRPVDGASVARLSPRPEVDRPHRIKIGFAPQALAEDVFVEASPGFSNSGGDTSLPPPGSVRARSSNPSRIVIETANEDVDYTLEALLDLFDDAVQRVGSPADFIPDQPAFWRVPDVTSLEIPAGLVLSPGVGTTWRHAAKPVRPPPAASLPADGSPTRTELWHTRLERGKPDTALTARVVGLTPEDLPGPLSQESREGLVARGHGASTPLLVDQLMLSALGGWLEVRGDWEGTPEALESSVVAWHHRMTMGRDQYVRLVKAGYLFPFGHRAVLVEVTQRKLQPGPDGVLAAYLRQRIFVLVRQPQMTYTHRGLPFTSIEVQTLATPNLRPPAESEIIKGAGERAFWLMVGNTPEEARDFPFRLVGTDHGEQETRRSVEFTSSMAFIDRDVFTDQGETGVRDWISSKFASDSLLAPRRQHAMGGARLAFAPRMGAADGSGQSDPVFDTDMLDIAAELQEGSEPPFRPVLHRALSRVPALMALAGHRDPVGFRYEDDYAKGTDLALGLFARLVDENGQQAELMTSFAKQQSGGLVAPAMALTALSRSCGPLAGDVERLKSSEFDLNKFFGGADPQLLGGVSLKAILPDGKDTQLPVTVVEETPGVTTTRMHWETGNLKETGPFVPAGAILLLDVVRRAPKDPAAPGEPTVDVRGELRNFRLDLPDRASALLRIHFQSLVFTAPSGKKIDVEVNLRKPNPVEFEGELSFVRTLANIIPEGGFSDPPSLSVTPEAVEVGYGLAIPTVALGAFTLQNLALSAGFHLPLLAAGPATVSFHVSERHNPFIVTYSALGGGGFFGLALDVTGVRTIELSVEFGGAVAINLGVASGGVSIMAGIYSSQREGVGFVLAGFVRANGVLEVLGLVSISAQFYLELSYVKGVDPAKLSGTASLTVKVKVLFFSKTVSLTVQREFSKGSDPTFSDGMKEEHWSKYCAAFAA